MFECYSMFTGCCYVLCLLHKFVYPIDYLVGVDSESNCGSRNCVVCWRILVSFNVIHARTTPFSAIVSIRSEERRVGKECRCGRWTCEHRKKSTCCCIVS